MHRVVVLSDGSPRSTADLLWLVAQHDVRPALGLVTKDHADAQAEIYKAVRNSDGHLFVRGTAPVQWDIFDATQEPDRLRRYTHVCTSVASLARMIPAGVGHVTPSYHNDVEMIDLVIAESDVLEDDLHEEIWHMVSPCQLTADDREEIAIDVDPILDGTCGGKCPACRVFLRDYDRLYGVGIPDFELIHSPISSPHTPRAKRQKLMAVE